MADQAPKVERGKQITVLIEGHPITFVVTDISMVMEEDGCTRAHITAATKPPEAN